MRIKKPIPFAFVLEALERVEPVFRPMFGCTSVYVGDRIVLILREKDEPSEDNGVWLATTPEHHESLRKEFPTMRSISLFTDGTKPTGWQLLPSGAPDFERAALRACELVLRGDERIGKIPRRKKKKAARK